MSLAFDLKFILSYDKKTFIYSYFATILLKKKEWIFDLVIHLFKSNKVSRQFFSFVLAHYQFSEYEIFLAFLNES